MVMDLVQTSVIEALCMRCPNPQLFGGHIVALHEDRGTGWTDGELGTGLKRQAHGLWACKQCTAGEKRESDEKAQGAKLGGAGAL